MVGEINKENYLKGQKFHGRNYLKFSRRGQVAIFVILGVLIVGMIILFFTLGRDLFTISSGEEFNVEGYISKCVRQETGDVLETILPQGGFIDPKNFKNYNDAKVTYLCENVNNYEPCVNQHPLLVSEIEAEIKENIEDKIAECFIVLDDELDSRNYVYSGGLKGIDVILKPDFVEVEVLTDLSLSKGDSNWNFDSFSTRVRNPIYDLATVASEIARQEGKYCYFEYLGFSLLYPEFDIRVESLSDSTKIYTIEDKGSGLKMNVAIRGCAIPQGV